MESRRTPSTFHFPLSTLLCVLVLGGEAEAAKAKKTTPPAVEVVSVKLERDVIERFDRCELTIQLTGPIENPFNPDEVALEATFTPPEGRPITVPGFYYQPFERVRQGGGDVVKPSGDPVWKVRFTPRRAGRWSYEVRLITPAKTQVWPGQPFLVSNSSRNGFLQLTRTHGTLQFETGQPFMPVGENLCWGPGSQPLAAYDRWLQALAHHRANYARLWLAPWSLRLETKETRVGRYDQLRAWYVDYLLEESARHGLYWQLCLLNHGQFSRSQDPDWDNNPYNEELGGMCRLPNDFLTTPAAQTMFRRLLRYQVARWGFSPQLASWELFNEADFGEFRLADLYPWVAQMSEYLRATDGIQRPITISFHHESPKEVWSLPTIDVIQWHVYDQRDFPALFAGETIGQWQQTYHKPVMVGEFGWIQEFVRKIDTGGIHLHDGLWGSAMSGALGAALIWYWDSYVHPNRLERHFRPVAIFWQGERLGMRLARIPLSTSDADLFSLGFGNADRVYLWIKNRTHNIDQYLAYRCEVAKQRVRKARGQTPRRFSYPSRVVQQSTLTLQGLDWVGRYRVEWWDPYKGRITSRRVVRPQWGGALTLNIPDVKFDLAAKVIKLQWWEKG